MKTYWVYVLTSHSNTVMYVGVTNDIVRRLYEHRNKLVPGFTSKYNVSRLVYFEQTDSIEAAILREKQIKGWIRAKKNALVAEFNPNWKDLAAIWFEEDPSLRSG